MNMRLVKLHLAANKEPVWVNPEHVSLVRPAGKESTMLYTTARSGDGTLQVAGTPEGVAEYLEYARVGGEE
jgi:hypothetical protein